MESIIVSEDEYVWLLNLIDNPPPPNAALISLLTEARAFTKDEATRYHKSLIAKSKPTGRKIDI